MPTIAARALPALLAHTGTAHATIWSEVVAAALVLVAVVGLLAERSGIRRS